MIVMDLHLDNIFSFNDFHINLSYPKKIVNSTIENEFLRDRPNFRYKKVVILMGANASGKTTLGKALMMIFNFISKKNLDQLTHFINDKTKPAGFSIDFIANTTTLYRTELEIKPICDKDTINEDMINFSVRSVNINKADSYETCAKKIELLPIESMSYIEALDKVEDFGWFFSYPESDAPVKSLKDLNKTLFLEILRIVLMTFDSSIQEVREGKDVEDTYIIKLNNHDLILQGEKILNDTMLSSGTKASIDIAIILTSMVTRTHGFYYCDEKFTFVHSDLEKELLSIFIDKMISDEQLFLTTHNTDILDVMLPKHSFVFLKKESTGEGSRITCVSADTYLKRNTDSLRAAVENDLFSTSPKINRLDLLDDYSVESE